MKLTIITLMFALTTSPSFAQTQGGNGGFAYKNSIKLLESAQEGAIKTLKTLNEQEFNAQLKEKGLAPLRLNRMIQSIKNLKIAPESIIDSEMNPSGQKFTKMFFYHVAGDPVGFLFKGLEAIDFVIVLKPFFETYATNPYTQYKQFSGVPGVGNLAVPARFTYLEVRNLLIHEAAHIQGYNELDAETLEEMISADPAMATWQ